MSWPEMQQLLDAFEELHPYGACTVTVHLTEPVCVSCAVADTDATRARGMTGNNINAMFFAYDQPVSHWFHLNGIEDTIRIFFIDAAGTIVHSGTLKPSATTQVASPVPYQWVLETRGDTSRRLEGLQLGAKVTVNRLP